MVKMLTKEVKLANTHKVDYILRCLMKIVLLSPDHLQTCRQVHVDALSNLILRAFEHKTEHCAPHHKANI